MICCTRLCRTTSFSPKCTTAMPPIFPQTSSASINPDFLPGGKSICVMSPVMTAFELNPSRVRNIFICSLVVFCASSRITKEAFQLGRVDHVVKRVVQWAHVRVDLLLQRPRQKAQTLARFHRGPRQNNAVYLLRQQRAHGHRHGNVSLAGSARADPKHHVMLLDLFHVAALAGIFRSDLFLAEGTRAAVLKHPPRGFVRFLRRY